MHDRLPRGQTRVSDAVLDATATLAASDVRGVLSVDVAGGAAVGGAVGVALGMVQGGPVGAALGASAGAAAGAAASHALRHRQRRASLSVLEGATAPPVHVSVTARYGEDLIALADRVRAEVEAALLDALGLRPGAVTVDVVDVVSTEATFGPDPS